MRGRGGLACRTRPAGETMHTLNTYSRNGRAATRARNSNIELSVVVQGLMPFS
jgi:hypothetical protein